MDRRGATPHPKLEIDFEGNWVGPEVLQEDETHCIFCNEHGFVLALGSENIDVIATRVFVVLVTEAEVKTEQ